MSSYGLEVIGPEQCAGLLASQQVGRVAVCSEQPGVFPVLFALLDGDVVFRTAPGEKLIAAALHRDVVFEVDSYSLRTKTGWSVNVLGTAEEIVHPGELERAHALELQPWAGDARDRYVRIRAREVTGRRIIPNL
jgi:hypothetical protein